MSVIQFLLDENVNPRLFKALRRHAPEMVVWMVGQPGTPPLQTLDPDILIWCEANGFSLVTNNRASMPLHLQDHLANGQRIPGIFTLNGKMTLDETVEELSLIWEASDAEEYDNQIRYLPISYEL